MLKTGKIILQIFMLFIFTTQVSATTDTLVYRSEYEKAGDIICDLNAPNEGKILYTIISGNSKQYYQIGISDGIISIKNPITDIINQVQRDTLTVSAGGNLYRVMVVDGFDYLLQKYNKTHRLLSNDGDIYIDNSGRWTAYNNLWGSGTAVVNTDFRSAILNKPQLPDSAIIFWDTPSKAEVFSGASVWSYINLFYGNRYNMRENLTQFPFQINSLDALNLDFHFEKLYGTNDFKIAMNMFLTNESYLTKAAYNDGDFFFVFDQLGNYIPDYPYQLPDTLIEGKTYALRYDNQNNGEFYERRRVIVKNDLQYLKGKLDINNMFKHFASKGFLNMSQYIYHIQLGIEVTQGFGAVRTNRANFNMKFKNTPITEIYEENKTEVYLLPADNLLMLKSSEPITLLRFYDMAGREISSVFPVSFNSAFEARVNTSAFASGFYIVRINSKNIKFAILH